MRKMTVGSLFSGAGGFDLGFHRAGFRTLWACEIDKNARAVFRRHWPNAEIHTDVTQLSGTTLAPVDVLIFGSPCQDLSVAGKRAGLAGARSGLFGEAMRIVDEMATPPRVAVWENVPGALSSNGGDDFAAVLTEMGQRWSGLAYRVLDLQYFGPPQRRRRVFVVGHSGGWASAAEVLFEREGVRWNPPTRGEEGKGVTQDLTRSLGAGGADDNRAQGGFYIPAHDCAPALTSNSYGDHEAREGLLAFGGNNTSGPIDVAACLNACRTSSGRQDFESETFIAHTLKAEGFDASEDGTGRGTPLVPVTIADRDVCGVLCADPGTARKHGAGGLTSIQHMLSGYIQPVAFHPTQDPISSKDVTHALGCDSKGGAASVAVTFTQNQVGDVLTGEVMHSPGTNQNSSGRSAPNVLAPVAIAENQRGEIRLSDTHPQLTCGGGKPGQGYPCTLDTNWAVRRLTPKECERLMGWDDGHTKWGIDDKGHVVDLMSDSARYRMCGNGVGGPVGEWIGDRIAASLAGDERQGA